MKLLPCLIVSMILATSAFAERVPIENVQDAVEQLKLDLPRDRTRALDWLNNRKNTVVDAAVHPNDLIRPFLKDGKPIVP